MLDIFYLKLDEISIFLKLKIYFCKKFKDPKKVVDLFLKEYHHQNKLHDIIKCLPLQVR